MLFEGNFDKQTEYNEVGLEPPRKRLRAHFVTSDKRYIENHDEKIGTRRPATLPRGGVVSEPQTTRDGAFLGNTHLSLLRWHMPAQLSCWQRVRQVRCGSHAGLPPANPHPHQLPHQPLGPSPPTREFHRPLRRLAVLRTVGAEGILGRSLARVDLPWLDRRSLRPDILSRNPTGGQPLLLSLLPCLLVITLSSMSSTESRLEKVRCFSDRHLCR